MRARCANPPGATRALAICAGTASWPRSGSREARVFRLRPRARAQNFPARGLRPHRVARRRGIADRRRYPVSGSGFARAGGCFLPDVRVDFPVHRAIRWQRHAPSRRRQRFCLSPAHGHSVLRHCRSAATPLFHDLCHRMGRLRVPVPAFRLFRLACAGEVALSLSFCAWGSSQGFPLCALVLFDAIRIADILFALLTAALLFWPPKPAESSARKERRHAPPR